MLTLALNAVTATAAFTGQQSAAIPVEDGPLGLVVDYTKGSSTSLEVGLEFARISTPGANDWFTPVDRAGASLMQVLTTPTAGRQVIDLATIFPTTAGALHRVLSGIRRCRVSVKVTGTATGNIVSVWLSHAGEFGGVV